MEKFIDFFLNRRLIVYLMTFLILVAGVGALLSFKRELVPKTNLPWVHVRIAGGSLPPEEMERKVTKPIEKELKSLAGIEKFSSNSSTGAVAIHIEALEGKGAEVKQEVQSIVNRVRNDFPKDVKTVEVEQVNYGDDFLMTLALTGFDLPVMFNLADTSIKDRLEAVEGVKKVEIYRQNVNGKILISLRPEEMELYQISAFQLMQQLQSANVKQSIGILENTGSRTVVEMDRSFKTVQQIGDTSIQTKRGKIPLRQLAGIYDMRGMSTDAIYNKDNVPYLLLVLHKTSECDVIQTSMAVQKVIKALNSEAQGHYELSSISDGASFIRNAVNNLSRDVMIGALLAIAVLLLFLRNWRVTMVISATIPLSVMMTFMGMKAADYNIDMVSLLSLSLSVGLMVDAAIVVLESIYQIREQGESLRRAIIIGTREVITPVLTSQLTIIIVFLPLMVVGLGGVEYKPIMQAIAFIVTIAIVASTIAALVFVPVYSNSFLTRDKHVAVSEASLDVRVTRFFTEVLAVALKHPKKTILGAALLLGTAVAMFPLVKTTTEISIDESYIQARLIMPKGSSLAESQKTVQRAAASLKELPENREVYTEAYKENATLHLMMKPKQEYERSPDTLMQDINQRLAALPDVERYEVGFGQNSSNTPVELEVVGKEIETIQQLDQQVQAMLKTIPGVRNPRSDFAEASSKMSLLPRTDAMERLGVDESSLMMQLASLMGEHNITTMTLDGMDVDVVARIPEQLMQHPEQLKRVLIQNRFGSMVPLFSLVDLQYLKTPNVINHKNGERVVSIKAELSGQDLGSVGRQIEQQLPQLSAPAGYSVNLAGSLKQQKENMSDVVNTFLATLALIYIIMVAQFGRLSHPFIILLSLPMAIVGVVTGLVLTQKVVSPIGMVGFIMLTGIVVSNAILLIDRINMLRSRGYDLQEAIMEGARNRVRPILMTKLTAILGLLPLALAFGEGADIEAPLAIVVIFGLIFHTVITLILVPVLYSRFESFKQWWADRRAAKTLSAADSTA